MFMETKPTMPQLANPLSPSSLVHAILLLKRSGVSPERVRLLLRGEFESYKGEIAKHLPSAKTEMDPSTLVQLDLASPSMVDQLPPSLFFDPAKKQVDFEKIELRARELFSPFDSAMAKLKASLEYIILVYKFIFTEPLFSKRFINTFNFPDKEWSPEELFFWMLLLPGFHQWAGTKTGTEKVLSIFLETKVRIKENQIGKNELPRELQSSLGGCGSRLGRDWSLGNHFTECDSSLKVIIGPVSVSKVKDFLPSGIRRKKLDLILDNCVPGQLRWSVTLKIKDKERSFSLGEQSPNCVLGYSTYLRNTRIFPVGTGDEPRSKTD